jgi:hypothetical protein
METESTNKPASGKITFLILLSFCTLFIVYYTVMSVLAPGRKLEELKKELAQDKAEKKSGDNKVFADSTYLRLLKERAYLQSRVVLAQTDSIYLTINLADSSMNLEISGVVVHRAKIGSYKASRLLTGNESIVSAMLAAPLTIASDLATIKKEPVMIKMAPKDTSEYKPDMMPDTSITEPVNYILEMTNGTRIFVYQIETDKREDRMVQLKFDLNDRMHQTWQALRRVAVLKVPEYHPYIKIKLPRSDAKIIYRAIPKYGQIALFL